MLVNKNGLPFYLDRELDVIRFGVDPYNHVKEQQLLIEEANLLYIKSSIKLLFLIVIFLIHMLLSNAEPMKIQIDY
nr:hypothetical protein [Enterococcus faecalis]